MSIKLSDSIRVGQQKPLEDKYFNELVPYTSTTQVNTLLLKSIRHIGLTVNINGEEYWYKDGIEDYDLVFKSSQKTIEVTKQELDILISENKLEPNRLYKITGVESWCFSQHLIKAIYLKAITNNTLELEGVGEFYTPKYNTSDSNLGIWKGELFANGMIDSLSYNIGDKVIWGNLFWENISGNIGTNEKESMTLGVIRVDNYLSEEDWQLITPNDGASLYNIQFNSIKYDVGNDYINYRADDLGNVYEINYNTLLTYDLSEGDDPSLIYYLNAISLFQWGRSSTYKNIIKDSLVSNCNYNTTRFYNNTVKDTRIAENNFLNVDIIGNNFKSASVDGNYLKHFGGIFENNLDNSAISLNKYYFQISNNTLKNYSNILNNNDNNIIVNGSYSSITSNNLDNRSFISSNTFVEEGKGVSGYIKGINGNEIINNSSINNNTIKNGSRIVDHNLSHFSTINGNTLDTDSNIYNNQVVQNGKIDNNILTGHGRIYGNQLDRQSEITLCKLRISPATSYATTIKNNRLTSGKIQNVDFGNIVNPVGSDPNNPAFGGNALSECIIENESIIKDLTFPNHGGVGIQFVKMNGASEFKNITINDSIIGVEFINTVFDETSDYSKIIQGAGYGGIGFTKYYLDNVLLQDRFDEKQDILTNPVTGTGTTNYLPKFTASGIIGNSQIFDDGTNVGIGTNAPTNKLTLVKQLGTSDYTNSGQHNLQLRILNNQGLYGSRALEIGLLDDGTGIIQVNEASVGYNKLLLNPINGNVGIGTLNPINKFTILGADDTLPTLGSPSGKLGIFNGVSGNSIYGMLYGVLGNGSSYIQSQRVDGIATAYDLLIQPSGGNVAIGKSTFITEKLDVNGYVKATGFKTPTGVATQALIANGGVFDLNTKADLVDGKVPATQLPSYVDDVLEYASWVNFPATGESGKIYIAIDTNLTYRWGGSSYVVMSSSLALGETSSTAYRGDRGKTAYDHSQETGNPHNTKVEELTDVGSETTSIADTDVILKKEVVGGFWRKITWENIKASLKTYFDSLYAPKSFNVKITTPSSYVTGTISETEVLRIEIPANSISDNSFFNMPILFFSKLGTNGNLNIKGKLSTSPTMPSGTTDVIFGYTNIAATNISFGMDRMYIISDGLIKGFPFGISSYSSSNANSNSFGSKAFDRTVTNYLYISIQLGNSADQARLEGVQLINQ